jgi:hypothetical protein
MARSHAPGGAENETKTARSAPEVRLDAPPSRLRHRRVFRGEAVIQRVTLVRPLDKRSMDDLSQFERNEAFSVHLAEHIRRRHRTILD